MQAVMNREDRQNLGSHYHVTPAGRHSATGWKCRTSSMHAKVKQNEVFYPPPTSLCHLSAYPERLHGAGPGGLDGGEGLSPEAAVSRRAGPEGQRGAAEEVRERGVAAGTATFRLCPVSPASRGDPRHQN